MGHACFHLYDNSVSVVTDPFDDSLGRRMSPVTADIVTISHGHPQHNHVQAVGGDSMIVCDPGEYEIKSVFITGIATYSTPQADTDELARNVVFAIGWDNLTVCHLGGLSRLLTRNQVEALGDVNVLLVPIGDGQHSLNVSLAAEVVSQIEPQIVVPMHYATGAGTGQETALVDRFVREMGGSSVNPLDSLRVSKTGLPEETQVVVLNSVAA